MVSHKLSSHTEDKEVYEVISDSKFDFADEYAIVGWFKWNTQKEISKHLAFRTTINDKESNENTQKLGDVELALWIDS